jgi:hypothetical protein
VLQLDVDLSTSMAVLSLPLPPRGLNVDDTALVMTKLSCKQINRHLRAMSRRLDVASKNELLGYGLKDLKH